jgi:hypothetical protein
MDNPAHFSTSPASSAARVVDVLVPVALNQAYSYRVPRGMELKPGDVVCVPLGPRQVIAVVWAENHNPDPRLHNRLKDVSEKLDAPPLRDELRKLVDWVANYTLSARGMVLRMTLRMGEHLGPERTRLGVRLAGPPPQRMTPARRRLIEVLSDGLLHGKSEAAREAGVSVGVIDGLVDEGTLAAEPLPPAPPPPAPDPSFSMPDFSRPQRSAVDAMRTGFFAASAQRGGRDAGAGGERQLSRRSARWRHRLGQDRGLFRSGCGSYPPRQAVVDPDAGDRADRTIPRPLCHPFRGAAAGMAFRTDATHPRPQLGRDRRRRSAGGGGRALRAVFALRQSRADRGR